MHGFFFFQFISALLMVPVPPDRDGEAPKGIDRQIFAFADVADTDNIGVRQLKGQARLRLRLANVMPFSQWPNELSEDELRLRNAGFVFLAGRLVIETDVIVTGFETGQALHADLLLESARAAVPGAPSASEKGRVHVNCLLIEEGYSLYIREPMDRFFEQRNFGSIKKRRSALYEEAETYAKANKKGIWRHEELLKKLKAIPR